MMKCKDNKSNVVAPTVACDIGKDWSEEQSIEHYPSVSADNGDLGGLGPAIKNHRGTVDPDNETLDRQSLNTFCEDDTTVKLLHSRSTASSGRRSPSILPVLQRRPIIGVSAGKSSATSRQLDTRVSLNRAVSSVFDADIAFGPPIVARLSGVSRGDLRLALPEAQS